MNRNYCDFRKPSIVTNGAFAGVIGDVVDVEMSYHESAKYNIRNGMNEITVSQYDFEPLNCEIFSDYGILIMNPNGEYKNGYILTEELADRMEELDMSTGRFNAYDALCCSESNLILKDRTSNTFNKDSINDVIFNNPATIVKWKDGTKTVVKCQDGDTYSEELGLVMCIVKKCCGNKGNYNDVLNKWLPKEN